MRFPLYVCIKIPRSSIIPAMYDMGSFIQQQDRTQPYPTRYKLCTKNFIFPTMMFQFAFEFSSSWKSHSQISPISPFGTSLPSFQAPSSFVTTSGIWWARMLTMLSAPKFPFALTNIPPQFICKSLGAVLGSPVTVNFRTRPSVKAKFEW